MINGSEAGGIQASPENEEKAVSSSVQGMRVGSGGATRLRLVLLDVDGCLTPGEGGAWNWTALETIGDYNRRAQQGEELPAVTLCTGRQEPYVEVLMQAIGSYLPGIYEQGCGLYFPGEFRFAEHPHITPATREALILSKETVLSEVVERGMGFFQPGKESSFSVYPLPGTVVGQLQEAIVDALAPYSELLEVHSSVSCVDVTPAGIDKGAGARWLSAETGIPLAAVGGIGDSPNDLPFLRLVGRSAAPSNAADQVRAAVDYVSPYENGEGVLDILRHWRTASLAHCVTGALRHLRSTG